MAERRADPRKVNTNAVSTLGLLLVLACATPVIASQNSLSDCAELEDAGLQVPITKLAAASISERHEIAAPDQTLISSQPIKTASTVPLPEAPVERISKQSLFDSSRTAPAKTLPGSDTKSTITQKNESTDRGPKIHTRIPGVSSVELQRFKRQMYRRDI